MHEAVDAFMAMKCRRSTTTPKPYPSPTRSQGIPRPHEDTVELSRSTASTASTPTAASRYVDPMYQRLTCQAQHVDHFYAEYYLPGSLTST